MLNNVNEVLRKLTLFETIFNKNSYLIYVLLKNSNFFWKIFLQYSTHFCIILFKKNTKINLKIGTKSSD